MEVGTSVKTSDSRSRRAGTCAIVGAIGFVAVVVVLHLLRPDYDPAHQLMSELAGGAQGWAMFVAFFLIAASTASLAFGIAIVRRSPWMPGALSVSSLCFLGAGIVPLGRAAGWHIALVVTAFVGVFFAMYLLPYVAPVRFGGKARAVSWGFAGATAACVVFGTLLGPSVIPIGVSQRLAAACVLSWLVFAGARLRSP